MHLVIEKYDRSVFYKIRTQNDWRISGFTLTLYVPTSHRRTSLKSAFNDITTSSMTLRV